MCRKLSYLLIPALVLGLAAAATNAKPLNQDPAPDGIVSVEAEHFDENVPQSDVQWELVGPTGGFTGEAGMQVNGLSSRDTDYAATSPRLDFEVNFVKTGTHYVWILAFGPEGGSDSCHSGLDGLEIDTCDRMDGWNGDYEWNNQTMDPERASFEVTTLGIHTLNVYMREDGLIVDKIVLTTNPDYTPTGDGPPESSRGPRVTAADPNPEDEATDVARNVILTWTPGAYGARHDVYVGTDGQAVADADTTNTTGIYRGRKNTDSYDHPDLLEYGQTYYWRIDEVNAPPDTTIEKGDVWSFTVEPLAYAIASVSATASSEAEDQEAENAENGSGLADDLHSNDTEDMWLSSDGATGPTSIEFEFDKAYKLHEMRVWNYNGESILAGFGLKNVTIEYSADGAEYTKLGDTHTFDKGTGAPDYASNTTIDFDGATARYVRITANSNWGGAMYTQYGLSEVRFFYIPIRAREPEPDSGATDVDLDAVLGWRVGREATQHNVYFSDSYRAVANGTAPMNTVTEAGYGPLLLDLGKIYFWRVDQINNLAPLATLAGDIWNFRTHDFLAVDDFEAYDTGENQIWYAWRDGLGFGSEDTPPYSPGNGTGAEIGDGTTASYAEETIVHGGDKSMPYWYNNSKPDKFKYSEAKMTLTSQRDWTAKGIESLTLWFRGNPAGFAGGPAGTYTMTAGGEDIWDASDEFRYAWKQLSGDGEIVVKVLSVEQTDVWAKAGLMIRNTLDEDSANAMAYITPDGRVGWQYRLTAGAASSSTRSEPGVVTGAYWLKLSRQGNTIRAQHSSDGVDWQDMVETANPDEPSFNNIIMNSTVYIGLALTSHNVEEICTAQFSDVQTSGTITSAQWTQQVVGPAAMPSNDAEQMYVAIANNTGTPAVVYWEDPDDPEAIPTQIDTWTEWPIDLKEFQDKGINLTDVNSIAIGFGDRNNPQPGGSGKMYFDDIRLYPFRCILSNRSDDFAKLDYVEDCVIDYREFEIMAAQWLYQQVHPGRPGDIWFEAEAADTISPPLQIYDDSEASGGQYMAVELGNSSGSTPPTNGHATYVFTIPGGTYKILGRTIAPSGTDDSFWARIEGAATQTENDPSGWIRYNIIQSEDWNWGPVQSMDDDDETVHFTMAAGTYTLEIAYREDGALLDALVITDDLDLDPVALSPLAADLNASEMVDFKDYAILADMWLDEQLWPAP